MALKALITKDDHAKLAKDVAALYIAHGEQFVLDVEEVDGFALKDVAKQQKALNEERTQREAAEKKLKAFGDLDPQKAREALDRVATLKDSPDVEAQISARVQTVRTKLESDIRERDEKLAAQQKSLESLLIEGQLASALTGQDGKPIGSAKLLMPFVAPHLKIEQGADGKPRVVVIDEKGGPRMTKKSGSADNMSLEEFVLSLKTDKDLAGAFYGTGHKGDAGPTPTLKDTEPGKPALPTEADATRKLEAAYARA